MSARGFGGACGVLVALALFAGCGTSAVGVDVCQQIEAARCRRAPGCGIALEPPYSTSGSSVDACIEYYDVACLHGLEVGSPAAASVTACVDAIDNGPCAIVVTPTSAAACEWLNPSQVAADAGDAGDAASDASSTDGAPDAVDEPSPD